MFEFPCFTGIEILEAHRDQRKNFANALRLARKDMRAINEKFPGLWSTKNQNEWCYKRVENTKRLRRNRIPFNPTINNLRLAAKRHLEFAKSDWNNPLDSEYYSACGYDDMQAEKRSAALSDAVGYFRAWKVLASK